MWIVEGETCVEALTELDIVATTSCGGSNAASKTEWNGLAGKRLVLVPDNDDQGRQYMDHVAQLAAAGSVRRLELPGLAEGGDVVDFVRRARSEGADDASIRARLLGLASEVESERSATTRRPFPIHVLPDEVVGFVCAVAASRSVDESVTATFALATMAAAMGLSRVAYDDFADWEEIPVVWVALVSRSGTRKTVIVKDFFGVLQDVHRERHLAFEKAMAAHNHAVEEWKNRKQKSKSPEIEPRPEPPVLEHVYSTDTTPEALVQILHDSPRGIVIIADELSAFFGGMGRYSGMKAAERGFYLSLFSGTQYKKDRKSDSPILIDKASACVVGGVQPGILRTCFDDEAFASGLASRFLLLNPVPQVKEYAQGPSQKDREAYERFIRGLTELGMEPFSRADGEIDVRPVRVPFDDGARELLRDFVPRWSAESLISTPDVEAAMSKLEAYSLRFALILRVAREIQGTAVPEDPITAEDFANGIELARWFRDEALDVYKDLRSDDGSSPSGQLAARAAVIRKRFGGGVTIREWQKFNTRRSQAEAEKELSALVEAKMATWRTRAPGPTGGRPTQECALIEPDLEGGVMGCGLRVASPESKPSRLPKIAPPGIEKEGGSSFVPDGRNPKPPDIQDEVGPDREDDQVAEELSIGAIDGPGGAKTMVGIAPEGGGSSGGGGDAGGRRGRRVDHREGDAPRNPQPKTPIRRAAKPEAARAGATTQPKTSEVFEVIHGLFDGVEVEPAEAVPIGTRSRRTMCMMCRTDRRWRFSSGHEWICGHCHPPRPDHNVEWRDPRPGVDSVRGSE